jgi:hypothetical protein
LVFRSPEGGAGGAQGEIFGILPRALTIPAAAGPVTVDGNADLPNEYAGAEQLVVRYRNGSGVADAVAHLVYRDSGGDRNLYLALQKVRDVSPNWSRAQSFLALNIDADLSGGAMPDLGLPGAGPVECRPGGDGSLHRVSTCCQRGERFADPIGLAIHHAVAFDGNDPPPVMRPDHSLNLGSGNLERLPRCVARHPGAVTDDQGAPLNAVAVMLGDLESATLTVLRAITGSTT